MLFYIIICLIGFILLYYGAEWLVKGSSSLARSLGITPIVIGLTVVAFGTSVPELVVSLVSSIKGKSMIALGNVVGSNICNIALILGIAACFQPLSSQPSVIKRDIPLMLGISFFLLLLSFNDVISRIEGAILFTAVILYTLYNYYMAMKENKNNRMRGHASQTLNPENIGFIPSRKRQIIMILIGIIGVVAGAQMIVDSAVYIMTYLGVDEKFIGLTLVAFGTSMPELATSVLAAIRKEMDISLGNLVGSNVFNILSVIGASAMVRPIPVPGGFVESGLIIDYAVMMGTSFLPWLFMRKTFELKRLHGVMLLVCYAGYLLYLIQGYRL